MPDTVTKAIYTIDMLAIPYKFSLLTHHAFAMEIIDTHFNFYSR